MCNIASGRVEFLQESIVKGLVRASKLIPVDVLCVVFDDLFTDQVIQKEYAKGIDQKALHYMRNANRSILNDYLNKEKNETESKRIKSTD